ncbi:hypothetical protein BFP76_03170 [Amylibacter kogurei]|uniref:CAAX protease n=1 Tax=Paramylibacter kogurei TaxID=1889778 RepID=A0A2G5K3Y1_9RHOB|nr:hypothetical protein [Amylibacter kogurei]PIB24238.1 hypothetical protein BFP76_03170 [Amylibacter kogurei]
MTNTFDNTQNSMDRKAEVWPVFKALIIVAVLWVVSSQLYYYLVDWLGLDSGYNDAPILFALFYVGWAIATVALFWRLLSSVVNKTILHREALYLLPILDGFGLFVVYFLPVLPSVSVIRAPENPPEFMFATAWYYLPKTADILFQQAIVMVLIFTAARAKFSIRTIAIAMAVAFGGFHLLLALDGFTPLYVARFTIGATAFGALLPYLYLRLRNGFRWAFSCHWGFYAFDATLTHLILAAPPWAQT